MNILQEFLLYQKKHLIFLSIFLGLNYADRDVTFKSINIDNHIVTADITYKERVQSYSLVQKIRRIRIGFQALEQYATKENRNALLIKDTSISKIIDKIDKLLNETYSSELLEVQNYIFDKIHNNSITNHDLIWFLNYIPQKTQEPTNYIVSIYLLLDLMQLVGDYLSDLWSDDRYIRDVSVLD